MSRGRRRALTAVGALLCVGVALSGVGDATASRPESTRITLTGRIGALTIDRSTAAEVVSRIGVPDYVTTGNIGQGLPPTPNYKLLGYDCRQRQGYTTCSVNYYINARRRRLESFYTTSTKFLLPDGVRVGMPANRAARIERVANIGGCSQGINVTTSRLIVFIDTRGGRPAGGARIAGGRVSGIAIDDRRHGVGVTICL